MAEPTPINCQTTLISTDPGNDCNQIAQCLVGFTSKPLTQPGACTCVPLEEVSRVGLCCCHKYGLQRFQRQQSPGNLDYISQSRQTLAKEPCVNWRVSVQAETSSTAALNTTSNRIANVSNVTVQSDLFTANESPKKNPFWMPPKLLPLRYELVNPRDLIIMITRWLSLCAHNDKIGVGNAKLTPFRSKAVPRISVYGYLRRLAHYAVLSSPVLLSMTVYLQRLRSMHPALRISSLNIHRLLLACATVASKCVSDCCWTNRIYARIGGVRATELAHLELELLKCLAWNALPHTNQLEALYLGLIKNNEGYLLEP